MTEDRQFQLLRLAAILSFLFAVVNHLLPPKAFAATQLLFDYEFGLTRRGLFGEVLNFFTGPTVSVTEINMAAAIISLGGSLVIYIFLMRNLPQTVAAYLLSILMLNSFAFASFTGNAGYLDAVLMALFGIALSIDGSRAFGLSLRLGVCVLGVLVHENMLPYFTALIGFDIWLSRRGSRFALLAAAGPMVVGFATVALLATFATFTPEQAAEYASYLQSKAEFQLDANSVAVIGRSFDQNFALMSDLYGTKKYWTWVLFDGLPLLAMAMWLIWLAWQMLGKSDALTRALMLGAILAPVSLNLIAFDVERFGAASVLCGFLTTAILVRHIPGAVKRLDHYLTWPVFTLLLVLNANIFTLQVSEGAGHTSQFPWVLLNQLNWLVN